VQLGQGLQQVPEFLMKVLAADRGQAEEILPLADPDDYPDTGGEAQDHRVRDELDQGAQAADAQQEQDQPGHQGRQLQAADPVLGGDPGKDHDKGPGGPGDLHPAAAEQRHQQAADDGGVDTLFGLDPGGDGEGHGQGQRHHCDNHPGHQVAAPVCTSQQSGFPRLAYGNHGSVLKSVRLIIAPAGECRPLSWIRLCPTVAQTRPRHIHQSCEWPIMQGFGRG